VSAAAYVLIVWAVASDGLPALPIRVELKATLAACSTAMAAAIKAPNTRAVCRKKAGV